MTISIGFGLGIIYTQNIASGGGGGPPTNSVAPVIAITAGGGYAGSTYTATPGTWSSGTATGQWTSDGSPIIGETASTYTMDIALEGTAIGYTETNTAVTADSNTIEMWVPTDAAGSVVAWFDAQTSSTITQASNLVSSWASRSGAITLDQAVGSNQPTYQASGLNSKPAIYFPNSNYEKLITSTGLASLPANQDAHTWLIVGYFGVKSYTADFGVTGTVRGLGKTGTNYRPSMVRSGNDQNGTITLGATGGVTTWTLAAGSSPLSEIYVDGTVSVSSTRNTFPTAAATEMYINTINQAVPVHAQEWVISTAAFGTSDRQKLEGYGAWRWGLQAKLPGGHPYASAGPTV